jgi:translation initiation factor 3 subunit C
VADLEDFLNETLAAQKKAAEDGETDPKKKEKEKKMSAMNAKGFNAMKQKLKRNNRDYATDISHYREDKFEYMMSSDEEEAAPVDKAKAKRDIYVGDILGEDDAGFSTVGRGGRTLQYTPESIFAHLRSITESRGKKNTDRAEQIRIMERLLAVAVSPYQKIRVLLTLISTRFDLSTGSSVLFMSQEQWKMYALTILIN